MSNDEHIHSTVEQALTGLKGQLEGELRAFVAQLERAGAEERNQAVQQAVQVTAEDLRRQADAQLAAVRADATREVEEAKRAAERQVQEFQHQIDETRRSVAVEAEERFTAQLNAVSEDHSRRMHAASTTIDELRNEINRVRQSVVVDAEERFASKLAAATREHEQAMSAAGARIDGFQRELDELKAEAEEAEQRLSAQLRVAIDDREREKSAAAATIEELSREVAEARAAAAASIDEITRTLTDVQGLVRQREQERDSALAAMADLRRQFEDERRALAAEADEHLSGQLAVAAARHEREVDETAARARSEGREEGAARGLRLERAIRAIDDARTLRATLEALGQYAAQETERAAVLLVKGARLQGWRLVGFDVGDPRTIDLDVEAAGLAGETVSSGTASRGRRVPPFGADDVERDGVALPITVGWAVVAVLYADAPRLEAADSLEVLARHASKVLEVTTLQQAVGLSAPQAPKPASVRPAQSFQ